MHAISKGDPSSVRMLLGTPGAADARDAHGLACVHLAAIVGSTDILEILVTEYEAPLRVR